MKMRRKKQIIIQTELLPPAPHTARSDLDALERLVIERVNAILADREDLILQPFFSTKKVADELRRLQTVPETRKWAFYFARWGCLICGTKRTIHCASGMCQSCKVRTTHRLKKILSEAVRDRVRPRFTGDLETIAKRALLKALPPAQKDGQQ